MARRPEYSVFRWCEGIALGFLVGQFFFQFLEAIARGGVFFFLQCFAFDLELGDAAVERFEAQRAKWKGAGMSLEEILAARREGHRY